LLVVVFFNELYINGLRIRYVALFMASFYLFDLVLKKKFFISNLLILTLTYFAVDVYLNGWYKQLGVTSGYTLYLVSYLFFLAGEYSYDRVFFYRLSVVVLFIHSFFIGIQFFYPEIYNKLYYMLNISETEINRGYFFTGFKCTSILSSFDVIIFGTFWYNYLYYYKKNLMYSYVAFAIIIGLSVLLMSRSSLLILTCNFIFNLFYSKKYLMILTIVASALLLYISKLDFSIEFMETSRNVNLDDGGRSDYIWQAMNYIFSHNFIIGEYNEYMYLEKAPHNVFINAFLYFGFIGFILIFLFYISFTFHYYRFFLMGYFEYLVILFFMMKTFFHNESIVTSGTLVFMFLLGGSIKNFKLRTSKIR